MTTRHDAISGAYKELHVIEDLEADPVEETPVGYLYEDFTLSQDANEITIEPGASEISITFDTHKQISAEYETFYVAPLETLEEQGLADAETGELLFDEEWDAARVYIYDKSPDLVDDTSEAVDAWELPNFRPRWDDINFPSSDEASISFTAHVNGRPKQIDPAEDSE